MRLLGQARLDEDGVHGCICTLLPEQPGSGLATPSFRDLRTGGLIEPKTLRLHAVA